MTTALFPLTFASEQAHLLTAIGLGFLFGFTLERAGFANARKLAAQFYLYDMTVFKVMFTAILVAMVGVYVLAGAGVVDLARVWINPTFLWAQAIGGFLLGIGFIMSGLCPGTSAVAAASGRWDGLVTFIGIALGLAVFAVAVDVFPWIERLYEGTSLGFSTLPDVLGVPAPAVVLAVVVMAGLAFVGAEKVERIFQARYGMIELTPAPTRRTPRVKFAVAGSLVGVVLVSLAWRVDVPSPPAIQATSVAPLTLAERLIRRDPGLVVLDVRSTRADDDVGIPGAVATDTAGAVELLARTSPRARVVVVDEEGNAAIPVAWPPDRVYEVLAGGYAAWQRDVLTPAEPRDASVAERERVARQHQLAAFFSGAAVQSSSVAAPPPVMPSGGGAKKKRAGGC
jgi:rhodanese-related sulfurtransferase